MLFYPSLHFSAGFVRLKITCELRGSIDGIQLTRFVEGEVYEVSTSLGSYLLAEGVAEPVGDATTHTTARDRVNDRRPRKSRGRE